MRGTHTYFDAVGNFYCTDPSCAGWDGVLVRWIPDSKIDPGEWARDSCPHCGREFGGGEDSRIETSEALGAYLDTLLQAMTAAGVADIAYHYRAEWNYDSDAVFRVIHEELMRQDGQR